jgi:hypothetical protein
MEPDRQPNPQLPVHAPIAGCWIVLPGILSMLGHLICVSLVLAKWDSLEDLNGGPLNFTRSFDGLPTDAPGLSWFSVFAPTWIAELVVVGMAIWLLPRTVRNLRILHINTIAQSMLCAIVYGLTPDEKWEARHNPGQPPRATGWGPVLGVIVALLMGAGVLMGTIAFGGQKFFEWQLGQPSAQR